MSSAETTDVDVPARIRDYLAARLGAPHGVALEQLTRIAVGWSHETWLFDATWRDGGESRRQGFCLRRDPGNALLRELSDLGEQFRVLQCLETTPLPTPKAYWYESDPAILGRPFLVMEKVAGECPSPWGRDGRAWYAAAAARGVLPVSFTDTLATLHTLDWRAAGLDFLGVPGAGDAFARRELAKWRAFIEQTGATPHPILSDLLCWLEANAPATTRLSLVHGAYRTGNLL
ncbi:MAG: phosphotransferase family protein, partial [Gammaproteobacteria bacterium]